MILPKNGPPALVELHSYCLGCKRHHAATVEPWQLIGQMESWDYKHSRPGCQTQHVKRRHRIKRGFLDRVREALSDWLAPWWLRTWEFAENANFQISFNASTNLTITSFASLASDTNLLAGASSAVVDNGASATLLDLGLSALIKAGTTPTASKEIDLYLWSTIDDTPTYPDTIDGTDAAKTLTNSATQGSGLTLVGSVSPSTASNVVYPFRALSLAGFSGGWLPRKWGVWLVHNSVAALNASGHQVTQKQSYVAG